MPSPSKISVQPAVRERLLHAAKSLFAHHGYEATTTVRIARAAHTSESQIMKLFGNKEGLLEAVLEDCWTGTAAVLRQRPAFHSPKQRLFSVLERLFITVASDDELVTLLVLERMRNKGGRLIPNRCLVEMLEVIEESLQAMREAGQLRADVSLRLLSRMLVGAVEACWIEQTLMPAHARGAGAEFRKALFAGVEAFAPAAERHTERAV